MEIDDCFVVYSPEDLSVEEFKDIFVKQYSWINALESRKDYFIYGSRGSGKSMLLNYLEFYHQLSYYNGDLKKFFSEERTKNYIGVMVHATHEELNTRRYELLKRNNLIQIEDLVKQICKNDLIMLISSQIIKTFLQPDSTKDYLKKANTKKGEELYNFVLKDMKIEHLDREINKSDFSNNISMLSEIKKMFLAERDYIKKFVNNKFQMLDEPYKGNYKTYKFLHSLIKKIKELFDITDFSFYILIDNGDDTYRTMQRCIDDLVYKRHHNDICFKIAIKKGFNWSFGKIETPHDYSTIDIDELYSTKHSVYYDKIKDIASKRLEKAGIKKPLEKFFPKSENEVKLLNDIKEELRKKYKQEYEEKKECEDDEELPSKTDYINNRVSKYAQAELFRRLKKIDRSYTGFDSIVHLSSGIIRQFLELSNKMVGEEIKKRGKDIDKINLQTQRDVTKKYADEFIDELEEKYKDLEKEGYEEEAELYRGLYNLIEGLGKFYHQKLMDESLKEPRVFTFTLKDQGNDELVEGVLELGVNKNYFQDYWYSSKRGLGKLKGYAFNRRLCPRYKIDHTSFRGRVELNTSDLKYAIENKKLPDVAHEETKTTLDEYGDIDG